MDLLYSATGAAEVPDRISQLNRHILAHSTATEGLASWCEAYGIGDGPIRTNVLQNAVSPRGERDIGYRLVKLVRGDVFLSVAEIRYRRDALSVDMKRQLEEASIPFGQIVAPLGPRRITTLAKFSTDWSADDVLIHHATVLDRSGCPIARVRESYQDILVA